MSKCYRCGTEENKYQLCLPCTKAVNAEVLEVYRTAAAAYAVDINAEGLTVSVKHVLEFFADKGKYK